MIGWKNPKITERGYLKHKILRAYRAYKRFHFEFPIPRYTEEKNFKIKTKKCKRPMHFSVS